MKNIALLIASLLLFSSNTKAKNIRLGIGNDHTASFTEIHFSSDAEKNAGRKKEIVMKEIPANPLNYIFTSNDEDKLLSKNCPAPYSGMSIPVQILVRDTGLFEIMLEDQLNEFTGFRFSLTDLSTMKIFYLRAGIPERIYLDSREFFRTKNYQLTIFEAPFIYPTPVSCFGSLNGTIQVRANQKENIEMRIRNLDDQAANYSAKGNEILFENLSAGIYAVEAWKKGVKIWEEYTNVYSPKALKPNFHISSDTIAAGQILYTDNYSSGGSWFHWETGNTNSAAFAPDFVFEYPGEYTITLTIADFAGCTAVTEKKILVKETEMKFREPVLK